MEFVKALMLDHWESMLAIIIFALALVLTGRRLVWFRWFNEIAFFAWDNAEKKGLLEGLKGAEKLQHYLGIYRAQYEKKWGTEPTNSAIARAEVKAAELSAKEKVIRMSDPT